MINKETDDDYILTIKSHLHPNVLEAWNNLWESSWFVESIPKPKIVIQLILILAESGGIRETQEMIDFCSKHNISSDKKVTKKSADSESEAYERVVKSDVRCRFVIDMKSL